MKKLITLAAVAALSMTGVGAAHAASVTVRPGDLNTADTRATGHVEFLRNGLHVWTEGNTSTDKAAGYFALSGGLPASASMSWVGSQPEPGKQLVFDADGITGNGNDYNILVGESVYGNVWWLTPSSSATAKTADPSGANNGGQGSEWFGTLAEWSAALPQARALAGGFSLGSGVKGDGIIERMQYGSDVYEFTSLPVAQDGEDGDTGPQGPAGPTGPQGDPGTDGVDGVNGADGQDGANGANGTNGTNVPAAVVNATGTYSLVKVKRGVRVTLRTDDVAGATVGKKVNWIVKADKKRVARVTQGLGATDSVVVRFPKKSGRHSVTVKLNGAVVKVVVVGTGR